MSNKKEDEKKDENTWRETRDLCPTDRKLREFGYHIRSRPRSGPALWQGLDGHVLTEAQAIKAVQEKIQSVKK